MRPAPGLVLTVALVALASACAGPRPVVRSQPPVDRPADTPPPSGAPAPACYASLDRLPIEYRPLPPRRTTEGCGFDDGVQLLDIGVPVPGLTAISCPAAASLYKWISEDVQGAAAIHFGSRVVRIQSWGTYSCRPVNSRPGGRLSEHSYGNAVDIAAFHLENGKVIQVESGWKAGGDETAFLRDVHKAACNRFEIVIGPDGDAFHRDHLHMDMGPRGPYCR
ncbi:hypothetical protein B5C34_02340 [Pacificimonas flava]|uniref:Extensin-like C-terminal domain-containing protein n=3 Tax=Sphingosinicellaceae TaxID=2820280 RepID=A0A219B8D4_9SPHN|nr:extensin family protein [Pacificimonas aurantium]OWV34597.1 hypothetical protein B5C34_02340 [Pacificimonas flava]